MKLTFGGVEGDACANRARPRPRDLVEVVRAQEAEIDRLSRLLEKETAVIADLKHQLERLQRKMNEIEERTTRSQLRFDAAVRFFEQRVDQIYGRILPVLGRDGGFLAGGDEPIAAVPMAQVLGIEVTERMRWQLENSYEFLLPGRFVPPLSAFGFRLVLGAVREGEGVLDVSGRTTGIVLYGPYKRLRVGRYVARWTIAPGDEASDSPVGSAFDIWSPTIPELLGAAVFSEPLTGAVTIDVPFEVALVHRNAEIELRVLQNGSQPFRITALDLIREDA